MTETRASYSVPVTITIPGLPPASGSPNSRVHWTVRHCERREYMDLVGWVLRSQGIKDLLIRRAMVSIEYVLAQDRRRDADNWGTRGGKPILDVLVAMGILLDDDSKHVSLQPPIFTVDTGRAPLTIVRIWDRSEVP